MSPRVAHIPQAAAWLDGMTTLPNFPLRVDLVRRAHADIGIEESATAANRSPYLDKIARAFGSPLGSAWCGLILAQWCVDVGVRLPRKEAGAVRTWTRWAMENGLWRDKKATALPGDIVVYDFRGKHGMGDHIGVVARVHGRGVRCIEGNTSWAGTSREGVACVMKPVAGHYVLGYITPSAST